MASFRLMSMWPVSYFRVVSRWLLQNRRDLAARVDTISAEMARIGDVRVVFATTTDAAGNVKATENALSVEVEPGTSLERLMRAYIAQGGNPLDICSFLKPDKTEVSSSPDTGQTVFIETQPSGGIVAPISASPIAPGDQPDMTGYEGFPGGASTLSGYLPGRMGGRVDRGAWDDDNVTKAMHQMRAWANQEIKERLQDLEWRIVKLLDLREQLEQERDEVLAQAFGGAMNCLGWDDDRFMPDHRVQVLIDTMKSVVYETEGDIPISYAASPDLGHVPFALEDDPSEMPRG